ncbi:Protein of unknown function [Gryllus bimaculatus]|nr:Protein of unknown function [Gryllus bimaculatus]
MDDMRNISASAAACREGSCYNNVADNELVTNGFRLLCKAAFPKRTRRGVSETTHRSDNRGRSGVSISEHRRHDYFVIHNGISTLHSLYCC